jgi:hypothetical protein
MTNHVQEFDSTIQRRRRVGPAKVLVLPLSAFGVVDLREVLHGVALEQTLSEWPTIH